MMGSCCLFLESRTVTVAIADRQSRMNLSVPALKIGLDDTTLVLVL